MGVPDWKLPPGVNRGLWDYLHDEGIARRYDASLAGSTLFEADVLYVERHCPPAAPRLAGGGRAGLPVATGAEDGPNEPCRLIDLGCGTGRLLIRLAKAGWKVVGVDLSAEMLGEARRRAAEAGVEVELLRANLAELDAVADSSFDHAACLFSTLGMVVGAEARRRVVAHAFRVLKPGGKFILHVHNRWWHLRDGVGRRWLAGDVFRSLIGRPDAGDRVMPPHQGIGALTLHLFTRAEAVRMLRDAGFDVLNVTPVGLGHEAQLRWPWLFGGWRAYGFLVACAKNASPKRR